MGDDTKIPPEITTPDLTNFTSRYEARNTFQGMLRRRDGALLIAEAADPLSSEVEEIDQTQVILDQINSSLTTQEGVSAAEQMRELTLKLHETLRAISSLKPVLMVDVFNEPAPGANTDINGALIDMRNYPGVVELAVTVTLTTASVFNYTKARSPGATTSFAIGLQSSSALTAGDAFAFTIPVAPGDLIAFQVETNSIINQLVVYGKYISS